MQGLMMDAPLLISSLIKHADRYHGDTEIVSRLVEGGGIHRYTYRDAHSRARRLANALASLGVRMHDRVATLAWNGFRHFELYYGVSGIGAVLHTINPRLFDEQLVYIANHAEDLWICIDAATLPIAERIAPQLGGVKGWIYMSVDPEPPKSSLNLLSYERLLLPWRTPTDEVFVTLSKLVENKAASRQLEALRQEKAILSPSGLQEGPTASPPSVTIRLVLAPSSSMT